MKALVFTLSLLTFACTVSAENTALVGGRLIDGYGHQPLANSVILIKNGVIEQVGTV